MLTSVLVIVILFTCSESGLSQDLLRSDSSEMKKLFFFFFDLIYLKFSENVVKLDLSHRETGSSVDSFVMSDVHGEIPIALQSAECLHRAVKGFLNFHWISAGVWLKGAVHSISGLRGTWPWLLSSVLKQTSISFSCSAESCLDVKLQKCLPSMKLHLTFHRRGQEMMTKLSF